MQFMMVPAPVPSYNITPGIYNCTGGILWIYNLLDVCVVEPRMLVAVCCSMISMIAWILNGLPQVIENYRRGIPDEAVSPWLLIFWFTGDTCNLVGTILMKQLVMQKVIASYSIVSDIVLISQFIYSSIKHRQKVKYLYVNFDDEDGGPPSRDNLSVRDPFSNSLQSNMISTTNGTPTPTRMFSWSGPVPFIMAGMSTAGLLGGFWCWSTVSSSTPALVTGYRSRELLAVKPHVPPLLKDWAEIAGYGLGYVSSTFYFSARIPQLLQNRRRQSTEGLSIFLFILAITGNVTYGLQIFLTSTDERYLLRSLPWILGSMGVLCLDVVMMTQFFRYRHNHAGHENVIQNEVVASNDSLDDTQPLIYT